MEGCTLREVCAQALDFPGQVTREMLLEPVSCLAVRVEVALEVDTTSHEFCVGNVIQSGSPAQAALHVGQQTRVLTWYSGG